MPSRKTVVEKPPTIPPDRAVKALSQQLERLKNLKNRKYDEAESDKAQWEHLTRNIIEGAFGDRSSQLSSFHMARNSEFYGAVGINGRQRAYDKAIQEFENLLLAFIEALRLQLPEEEVKGFYEPADEYAFYRDLSSLIQAAAQEVFIVDAYLDEQVFNLYVSKVPNGAPVRILSNKIGTNVETVARMYAKSSPLELRSSSHIHDRVIFLDQRGWVTGQSIKDAARKKPTYLIELDDPLLTASRNIHSQIWAAASVII
jgi:hypothetical protein